jgi:hypothetical protein
MSDLPSIPFYDVNDLFQSFQTNDRSLCDGINEFMARHQLTKKLYKQGYILLLNNPFEYSLIYSMRNKCTDDEAMAHGIRRFILMMKTGALVNAHVWDCIPFG